MTIEIPEELMGELKGRNIVYISKIRHHRQDYPYRLAVEDKGDGELTIHHLGGPNIFK